MDTHEKRNWSTEDNFKLISVYETMPELWHQSDPLYKEQHKKRESLQKLAQIFDTNTHEMRRKLHNIRAQFSCELRRLKVKSMKLKVPAAEIKSEWKFFSKLSYLLVNYPHFYNYDSSEKLDEDTSTTSNEYKRKCSQSDDEKNDSDVELKPSTSNPFKLFKSEEIFIPEEEEFHLVPKRKRTTEEDHRIFGEYVASELRNLSENGAQKLKLKIKRAILQVTEEEFNKKNGAEYLEIP